KADLAGSEIHLVYSARDLARALPAAWQESIKQGRKWPYRKFLRRTRRGKPWFFRAFDIPSVLETWGAGIPPQRIHLVTVPQRRTHAARGATPWPRFCEASGIDLVCAPLVSDRSRPPRAGAETQLLRQLIGRRDRATRGEAAYESLIRDMRAQNELVKRESAP